MPPALLGLHRRFIFSTAATPDYLRSTLRRVAAEPSAECRSADYFAARSIIRENDAHTAASTPATDDRAFHSRRHHHAIRLLLAVASRCRFTQPEGASRKPTHDRQTNARRAIAASSR